MADLERLKASGAAWWESWFDQWEVWVVQRAARAEVNRVEMFVPLLFAESTFQPEVYPNYGERWREILRAIREVYSGTLAMSFVNADERLTFIDAFDVGLVTVFTGMYTSTDLVADTLNPTLEEATRVNEFFLSFPQPLIQAGTPIYYILTINSSDGQVGSEGCRGEGDVRTGFPGAGVVLRGLLQGSCSLAVDQRCVHGAVGLVRPVPSPCRRDLLRCDA